MAKFIFVLIFLFLAGVVFTSGCVANTSHPVIGSTPTSEVTPNFNVESTLSVPPTGMLTRYGTPVGTPIPAGTYLVPTFPPIPQRSGDNLTPFTPFITCPCQISSINLYNGTLIECVNTTFVELLQSYKVIP